MMGVFAMFGRLYMTQGTLVGIGTKADTAEIPKLGVVGTLLHGLAWLLRRLAEILVGLADMAEDAESSYIKVRPQVIKGFIEVTTSAEVWVEDGVIWILGWIVKGARTAWENVKAIARLIPCLLGWMARIASTVAVNMVLVALVLWRYLQTAWAFRGEIVAEGRED